MFSYARSTLFVLRILKMRLSYNELDTTMHESNSGKFIRVHLFALALDQTHNKSDFLLFSTGYKVNILIDIYRK
jgi:hypothetical protein